MKRSHLKSVLLCSFTESSASETNCDAESDPDLPLSTESGQYNVHIHWVAFKPVVFLDL